MAPTLLVIALAFAISVQGTLGNNIECGNLNEDSCAYAVSSSGKRCLLEKRIFNRGFTCGTSEIIADKLSNWIESNECVSACGVDRKALGISSDSLLDHNVAGKICSERCYNNCPNIVDLYFNLAAGEGVYLPKLCNARESNGGRREMAEMVTSSSGEAYAPATSTQYEVAADGLYDVSPTPAPAPYY